MSGGAHRLAALCGRAGRRGHAWLIDRPSNDAGRADCRPNVMPALVVVVSMPDPLMRAENEDCSRLLRLQSDGLARRTRALSEEAAAFELGARFGQLSLGCGLSTAVDRPDRPCWHGLSCLQPAYSRGHELDGSTDLTCTRARPVVPQEPTFKALVACAKVIQTICRNCRPHCEIGPLRVKSLCGKSGGIHSSSPLKGGGEGVFGLCGVQLASMPLWGVVTCRYIC